MKYVLDTHTHTIVSGHAYNTMNEMAKHASEMGLEMLGITDHAPDMPGSCSYMHFLNLRACPREKYGIRLMFGAELNIKDYDGTVDLPEHILQEMDYCIASIHPPCYKAGTIEENTNAYIHAMENPYVNIIGHPDDDRFPIDYEAFVKAAKKNHVLVEMNNSSLLPTSFRKGADEIYKKILKLCMQYEVPIVLGSDSHIEETIACFSESDEILKSLDFPEELIMNTSLKKFTDFISEGKQKKWYEMLDGNTKK